MRSFLSLALVLCASPAFAQTTTTTQSTTTTTTPPAPVQVVQQPQVVFQPQSVFSPFAVSGCAGGNCGAVASVAFVPRVRFVQTAVAFAPVGNNIVINERGLLRRNETIAVGANGNVVVKRGRR